jgi:hypothetical protein
MSKFVTKGQKTRSRLAVTWNTRDSDRTLIKPSERKKKKQTNKQTHNASVAECIDQLFGAVFFLQPVKTQAHKTLHQKI